MTLEYIKKCVFAQIGLKDIGYIMSLLKTNDCLTFLEKIELQNARESKEAMKIDFIKAILRYDGKFKEGLQEITATPHYFIEKDVRGITAIDHLTQVEETDFKNVVY